jgi:hypothetical protein
MGSASPGIRPLAPLRRNDHPRIHSPRTRVGTGRRSAPSHRDRSRVRADGATRRHPVPPSWFLTTSAACSARRLRVCCASLPAMGFTAFPVPRFRAPEGVRRAVGAFPAARFTPFEEFPSSTAAPHRCDPCRPAVSAPPGLRHLPRRPLPDATANANPTERPTSRPCSVDESVAAQRRFQRRAARSFHGLCSPSRSERAPLQPGPAGKPASAGEPARADPRGVCRRGESRRERPRWHPSESSPPCRCGVRGEPRRARPGGAPEVCPKRVVVESLFRGAVHHLRPPRRPVAMWAPWGWLHRPSWGL